MAAGGTGRLRRGEVALIVVVTVLVLVFVVMLVQRLDASGTDRPGATPDTTSTSATSANAQDSEEGTAGGDLSALDYTFVTPSGNIACAIGENRTVCGIRRFEYDVPEQAAARCEEGNVGHFLAVSAEETTLLCDTSGPEPAIDTAGVPVLGYGESTEANGFTCLSEETGVTCTHEDSGRTISVRRALYTL